LTRTLNILDFPLNFDYCWFVEWLSENNDFLAGISHIQKIFAQIQLNFIVYQ